jgi:hypothetical protein
MTEEEEEEEEVALATPAAESSHGGSSAGDGTSRGGGESQLERPASPRPDKPHKRERKGQGFEDADFEGAVEFIPLTTGEGIRRADGDAQDRCSVRPRPHKLNKRERKSHGPNGDAGSIPLTTEEEEEVARATRAAEPSHIGSGPGEVECPCTPGPTSLASSGARAKDPTARPP